MLASLGFVCLSFSLDFLSSLHERSTIDHTCRLGKTLLDSAGALEPGSSEHETVDGSHLGFPKIRGTVWGVAIIIKNIIFGGLYWVPLFWEATIWHNRADTKVPKLQEFRYQAGLLPSTTGSRYHDALNS